jgi:benzoylformate decarboxylase
MHALKDHPELTYVMAMQESLVVAMADGFSRASGRLVACNVHVAPGLGNAMGSLYNAKFTGTPMILTAGQQEQGHGLMEPLLYGPLVQMAESLVKWAVEVTRLEDLPRIVRRAAKIATTPPTGPVFISLPGDILNAEADIKLGRSTRVDTRVAPSKEVLRALADRILSAERPVIIVGGDCKERRSQRGGPTRFATWLPGLSADHRLRRPFRIRAPMLHGRPAARSAANQKDPRRPRSPDSARFRPRADVSPQ